MSTPPFLALPGCARAVRLATSRGEFAALRSVPDGGTVRGTVLLAPGFTGSKEDFIGMLEPLAAAGFAAVAVDLRGQYQTGGPDDESAYALDRLGLDLLAVGAAVRAGTTAADGPMHLLGHSFGGLVAREAVLRAWADPDVPGGRDGLPWSSLALLSSGPGSVAPGEQDRLELLRTALADMTMDQVWSAMRELDEAAGRPAPSPEVAAFLHRRWLANVPAALVATGQRLSSEPDRTAALAAVPVAVLVVSGEQDEAWPVAAQEDMALRLGAEYAAVPGAGHSPNADRPGETAAALAAFWSSVS